MGTDELDTTLRYLLDRCAIHSKSAGPMDYGRIEELAHLIITLLHNQGNYEKETEA